MPVSNTRKARRNSNLPADRHGFLIYFHRVPKKYRAFLKSSAYRALAYKKRLKRAEINIVLVSKAEIRELNKKFRGVGRFTDVISFRYGTDPLEGDIYISKDMSRKQAERVKHAWKYELAYLIIHGILHLFGFRDYTSKEIKKMFTVQDKIFEEIEKVVCRGS
jgi:probable rRNA maturation factor